MPARRIRVGCEFSYAAAVDTPVVFQVRPTESPGVCIESEWWSSDPAMAIHGYADLYGNPCARAVLPSGRSAFAYHAVTVVPDEADAADPEARELDPGQLPDEVLVYTLPSRYCLPDVLGAEAWSRFGDLPPGYRRVESICQYVHQYLVPRPVPASPVPASPVPASPAPASPVLASPVLAGPMLNPGPATPATPATAVTVQAADVNLAGRGTCRDFTHLAISFCRALNIPARYVFGYLPDLDVPPDPAPMDFAAWMEVWLGDGWWTFDPRNNARRKGRVVVGRGRDASDAAMVTTFGGPQLLAMTVEAEEAGPPR